MNHEELLAKIDKPLNKVFANHQEVKDLQAALCAVVELHKPYQGDKGYTIPLNDCVHCSDGDTSYPCPTIQAIINQL